MNLTIVRTYLPDSTTGKVITDARTFYTIEQPWRDNANGISCVPEGVYDLVRYLSPRHGATWYLRNLVIGVGGAGAQRSYCELHSANWARQLQGCIAFGLEGQPMLDPATGRVEPAVEHSIDAIEDLHELLGDAAGHTLTLTSETGYPRVNP